MHSEAIDSNRILLSKKIQAPTLPDDTILRTRLSSRLCDCSEYPVTIIKAPAGYGKSCLVASWMKCIGDCCAWVNLDEEDSRLERFWYYLLSSAQEAGLPNLKEISSFRDVVNQENILAIIEHLCSMLEEVQKRITLIVEDYHFIAPESSVHASFAYFLANLPENTHVVITSRTYPNLGLAKLKLRGRLKEMCETELMFRTDEVIDLFMLNGVQLEAGIADAITDYTKGWPVAVKLLSLSYDEAPGTFKSDGMVELKRLAGSYLFEEVIDQLPADIKSFLKATCHVNGFSASLAAYLTGEQACEVDRCIEFLRENSLFITSTPHSETETWYSYHDLFAEAVKQKLAKGDVAQRDTVYRKAIEWYEENGFIEDAISVAEIMGDYDVIKRAILQLRYGKGHTSIFVTAMRWFGILPEAYILQDPELCLFESMCLTVTGDIEKALELIAHAETFLGPEKDEFYGLLMSAKALPYNLLGADEIVIECSKEGLAYLAEDEDYLIGLDKQMLAGTLSHSKPEESVVLFEEMAADMDSFNENQKCSTLTCLSLIYAIMGQFDTALKWADMAMAPYGPRVYHPLHPMLTYSYVAKAIAAHMRGDYATAHACTDYELEHAKDCWNPMAYAQTHTIKAMMAFDEGDVYDARSHALAALEVSPFGFARSLPALPACKVWLEEGLIGKKVFVSPADTEGQADPITWMHGVIDYLEGDFNSFDGLVEYREGIPRDRVLVHIGFSMLITLILDARGEAEMAEQEFERFLGLVESIGAKQVIFENEPYISDLLKRSAKGENGEYALGILSELAARRTKGVATVPADAILTNREEEVFRLILLGMSTKEIASELVVSPETVKKHVANVYARLKVHSRVQAISKLRELDLL